jgi:hypothetical protein
MFLGGEGETSVYFLAGKPSVKPSLDLLGCVCLPLSVSVNGMALNLVDVTHSLSSNWHLVQASSHGAKRVNQSTVTTRLHPFTLILLLILCALFLIVQDLQSDDWSFFWWRSRNVEVDEGSIYELQSDKFFPSLGWVLDMSLIQKHVSNVEVDLKYSINWNMYRKVNYMHLNQVILSFHAKWIVDL